MSNKHNRPTVKTSTMPSPLGDLLPPLPNPGIAGAEFRSVAVDEMKPIQTSPIRAVAEQSAQPWAEHAQERADAATGQPGPAAVPSGGGLLPGTWIVGIEEPWYQRLLMLAARAGVDPPRYLEGLIKAKWVLGPMDHPVPR